MVQLRTYQSNFSGGEMSDEMQSRTDVSKYQAGVKRADNFIIYPQGGLGFRGGWRQVCEVADSSKRGWLAEFNLDLGESYVLVFGKNTLRFIRDGALVLDSSRRYTDVAVDDAAPAVFTRAAHGLTNGETLFIEEATGAPELTANFYTVANATTDTFTLVNRWGVAVDRDGDATLADVIAAPVYEIATPYSCNCARELNYSQDQNRIYLASLDHPVNVLTRVQPDEWTLVEEDFEPAIDPPTGVTASIEAGSGSTTYTYVVSAIDEETGEESLPSASSSINNDLTVAGRKNKIEWDTVAGAARYVVYKEENGIYGFIGGTEDLSFIDENITPDVGDTPQRLRNPFDSAGNYPAVVGFFEQRFWAARTKNNPGGVWASQTTQPRNFNVSSPVKDSDAITFRLRGTRAREITALVPAENLFMMTTGGEWLVSGGDVDEPLTPANIKLRQRAYRGSEYLAPLMVGDLTLHIERGGNSVRDFRSNREVPSTDLTLLARHLFRKRRVVSWAYSQLPNGVVWVVLDNGQLLSMTYQLEHELWGWTRHSVGGAGAVESVVSVLEQGEDAVYAQVRRTINGATRRYIHRLCQDSPDSVEEAFHVDAGLTYEGDPTDVIFGFDHLEGETLVALADGNVLRDLVVTDGAIDLPFEASVVHAGLPYTGRIETLDLDLGPLRDSGTVIGRFKSVSEVMLRVVRARALWIGSARGTELAEFKQRELEAWGDPIEPFTGEVRVTPYADWDTAGRVIVEQRDPVPAYIAGMVVEWEFGE